MIVGEWAVIKSISLSLIDLGLSNLLKYRVVIDSTAAKSMNSIDSGLSD